MNQPNTIDINHELSFLITFYRLPFFFGFVFSNEQTAIKLIDIDCKSNRIQLIMYGRNVEATMMMMQPLHIHQLNDEFSPAVRM